MQVLEAGPNKYLLLELDQESISNIAKQTGFECKIEDRTRVMSMDLTATDRQAPLLLFDAADPGNLGVVLALPVLCRWQVRRGSSNALNISEPEGSAG